MSRTPARFNEVDAFGERFASPVPPPFTMSESDAGSNEFLAMRSRLLKALSIALGLLLLASPVAALSDDDDDDEDEDEFEDLGEDVGTVSAWLLGLTLAYFGWKRVLPTIRKHLKQTEQKDRLKSLNT